jgi:hypothetical protein
MIEIPKKIETKEMKKRDSDLYPLVKVSAKT